MLDMPLALLMLDLTEVLTVIMIIIWQWQLVGLGDKQETGNKVGGELKMLHDLFLLLYFWY
jgi:hypothetical protein